eukprot:1876183-Rhodomonas_salina.2
MLSTFAPLTADTLSADSKNTSDQVALCQHIFDQMLGNASGWDSYFYTASHTNVILNDYTFNGPTQSHNEILNSTGTVT